MKTAPRRRRRPRIPAGSPLGRTLEYGLLLLGSFVIALSFNWLLNPNRIASGGVTGISTILQHVWGIEPAYTQWGLNIPLWLLGIFVFGGRFGVKTLIGSFVLPLFVLLTAGLEPLTDQPLLAAIFGGAGVGLGLGLVFRGQGSTGGLDLAAQVLNKWTGAGLGVSVALLDGMVIAASGLAFSAEQALYALIGLLVTSRTIDIVQVGLNTSKVAYIISARHEEIREAILHDLDRGLTELAAVGGYTREARPVLMVVLGQREVARLRSIVGKADPEAFVIIGPAAEVFGEGFKLGRADGAP